MGAACRVLVRYRSGTTLSVARGARDRAVCAGRGTDILVRTIAPRLSEALGQQLVIDNRAGGGSTIGSELAARSPADGYTLLMVDTSFTTNPSLYSKLPYDSVRDFAPVSLLAAAPVILIVHPSGPRQDGKGIRRARESQARAAQLRLGRAWQFHRTSAANC